MQIESRLNEIADSFASRVIKIINKLLNDGGNGGKCSSGWEMKSEFHTQCYIYSSLYPDWGSPCLPMGVIYHFGLVFIFVTDLTQSSQQQGDSLVISLLTLFGIASGGAGNLKLIIFLLW